MGQISDDLYLGTAIVGGSYSSVSDPAPMTVGTGPMGRFYCFDVVPVASSTTTSQNQIALSQHMTASTALTLTAGTGTTSGYDSTGTAIVILDCARTVAIYSAADLHLINFTISGYDQYGQAMSQVIAGPNATTVQTTKCFKSIKSIVPNTTDAVNNVVVGIGTGIGLPFRLTDLGYVASVMYNQTAIAITSTLVKVADTTSPATTATTDVRGYVIVGQTDGSKRLIVNYALPGIACGPSATRVGAVGVTQV